MKTSTALPFHKQASLTLLLLLSVLCCYFVDAQQTLMKSECNITEQISCESSNRNCVNYTELSTFRCGYCMNGYIEINDECYDINDIKSEDFDGVLTKLLKSHLPEYAAKNVSRQERVARLFTLSKVISYWNSLVPPPQFTLGINYETFLSLAERKERLGVLSNITYNPQNKSDATGDVRGELGWFQPDGMTGDSLVRHRRRRLEEAIDWHAQGYTTKVKNQGLCGCCWAVSTAAAIESALLITNQTQRTGADLDSISFQQLISCDEKNLGCDGGNILYATKYAWDNNDFSNGNYGGLLSYADYPFNDFSGQPSQSCEVSGKTPKVYLNYPKVVTSISDRSSFEERRDLMMAAVNKQPITTVMRSDCDLFASYGSGVLTHDEGCQCCDDSSCIDHAVVIVGYNTTAYPPYWKLRNSWGSNWGEEGHFRIAMNDPGCGWGLFGMLAESAIMEDAYNTFDALPERPGWWETALGWQKTLVIMSSILGFFILGGCICKFQQSCRSKEQELRDKCGPGRQGDQGSGT